jgi:phosphatidylinositol kinase/protein kinase (PI-3  family)
MKDLEKYKAKEEKTDDLDRTMTSDFFSIDAVDINMSMTQEEDRQALENKYKDLVTFSKLLQQEEMKIHDKNALRFVNITADKMKEMRTVIEGTKDILIDEGDRLDSKISLYLRQVEAKVIEFNERFPPSKPKRSLAFTTYLTKKVRDDLDKEFGIKRPLRRTNSLSKLSYTSNVEFLVDTKMRYNKQRDKIQVMIDYIRNQDRIQSYQEIESATRKWKKNKEAPRPFGPWGELWSEKTKRIASISPYAHFPSYQLRSIIVKGGDDLRQEVVAMQLILKFHEIFKKAQIPIYIRPYDIIVTSANSGLLGIVFP